MRPYFVATLVGWSTLAGCSSEKTPSPETPPNALSDAAASAPAPDASAVQADQSGRVSGTVTLASGAVPLAPPIELGTRDTVVAPGCPPIGESERQLVQEHPGTHGLSPVHIAITGMRSVASRAPTTHEISIEDCRLSPKLVALMTGDTIKIRNRSKNAFLPLLPGDAFMQAMMPSETREQKMELPGVTTLKCGFGSYCGRSELFTVKHPLYAVTDAEGRFEISGLPLDQELTVNAWHPLFAKPATFSFTLSKAEPSQKVELKLEGATDVAPEAGTLEPKKATRPAQPKTRKAEPSPAKP